MRPEIENHFLNPPAGSAAARAADFGIDLTLTLENLRLTPEERVQQLDSFIREVAKLRGAARRNNPINAIPDRVEQSED
jgi:hypothetical protein